MKHFLFFILLLMSLSTFGQNQNTLQWSSKEGVIWKNSKTTIFIDGIEEQKGPLFLIGASEQPVRMTNIKVVKTTTNKLELEGKVSLPKGLITVNRIIAITSNSKGSELTEKFELYNGENLKEDMEVIRPFAFKVEKNAPLSCSLPEKYGYFSTHELQSNPCIGEYRLGNFIAQNTTAIAKATGTLSYEVSNKNNNDELALPMVALQQKGNWQATICTDPYFSSQFTINKKENAITGKIRYRYWSSNVALEKAEKRTFAIWIGNDTKVEPVLKPTVDAFFRLALSDVKAGPEWVHNIFGLYYDCMHQKGTSWDKDMDEMAKRFGPENTKYIAVTYHCWYDRLGSYAFDYKTGKILDEWKCEPLVGQDFTMTKKKMHEQLAHAKKLGFKTLIYFGDGLADCSARKDFQEDWLWTSLRGKKPNERLNCWSPPKVLDGPPCFGRNPAHPDVIAWHHAYLAALLKEFGDVIDGFTWDETFHIGTGYVAATPKPSYSDRAFMYLIRDLTKQLHEYDPTKVFLSSDDVGIKACWGQSYPNGIPGYAMVTDGNWQDSGCNFGMWAGGLFPNWQNFQGSCNWFPYSRFDEMKKGAQIYGTPISFSTGGGAGCSNDARDISSPHEWTDAQWNEMWIPAFKERVKAGSSQIKYLTVPADKVQKMEDVEKGARKW